MLTLITAAMLSMAAMKADPLNDARKAYNNCLIETHNKAIADRQPVGDFTSASETACADKREAYRVVIVRSERSFGSSQKDAEAYAKDEVQMIIDAIVTSYNENFENKASLSLEK